MRVSHPYALAVIALVAFGGESSVRAQGDQSVLGPGMYVEHDALLRRIDPL